MSASLTVGSLCTGYGGLDLALKAHFPTRVIWTSEIDKHASRVVKARYRAPNLGDLKLIDWDTTEPPDILTAGYPCQPFSYAGRRDGIQDERHIWPWIAEGIRRLRPRLVFMENVPGHLTKGFGEVIGTLAEMGYDATWGCVRASDAGAPHRRERVFIVATDTENVGHERPGAARRRWDGPADRGDAAPDANGTGRQGRGGPVERPREFAAAPGGVEPLLPTPTAADGERRSLTYCRGNPTLIGAVKLLPTPTVVQGRNATSGRTNPESEHHDGWTLNDVAFADKWGDYAAAIARWEPIIGRPAPEPVDAQGRLSPVFVEWMMGLPAGWVTGLTDYPKVNVASKKFARSHMLKILGNGVVPQQAALALTHLLPTAFAPPLTRPTPTP